MLNTSSLVNASQHSTKILKLLELKIDENLTQCLVRATEDAVNFALGFHASSSSQPQRPTDSSSGNCHSFDDFVMKVVTKSEVTIGVLLVALVYIHRSKSYLVPGQAEWLLEQVFLGALITAAKYTNDSTLKNIHWSFVTGFFGKRDIGRVERGFLSVLSWQLSVTESDILEHYNHIMAQCGPQARNFRSSPSPEPAFDFSSQCDVQWNNSDDDSDYYSPSLYSSPQTPSIFSPTTAPSYLPLITSPSSPDLSLQTSHTLQLLSPDDKLDPSVSQSRFLRLSK